MDKIKIQVSGNIAKVIEKPRVLTSGTVGLLVEFVFEDEQWDSFNKTAVFRAGCLEKIVADVDNETTVPWEVMDKHGLRLEIGIYGVNGNGSVAIPTVWATVGVIRDGADPYGDEANSPALPIWKKLEKEFVDRFQKLEDTVRDGSITLKNEADRTEVNIAIERPSAYEDGYPTGGRIGFYETNHDGAVQLTNIAEGTEANHAATVGQVVLTSAQTLTDEQKRLARENIGAAAVETPRVKAEITYEFRADGAVNKNNKYEAVQDGVNCRYTNLIPVVEGDRFSYYGWSIGENYPNVLWFDENGNVLTTERWGDIPERCRLVTVPAGVSFVRFCTSNWSSANSESDLSANAARFEVCHVAREDEEREIVLDVHVGAYYSDNNELISMASTSTKRTNPIPIVNGDVFYFAGNKGQSKAIWYDATGAKIGVVNGTGLQLVLTPPANAVLVRFISFEYSTNLDKVILNVSYETKDLNMEQLKSMNYLWGKKYVACGDSFTAGPFDKKDEETWDETMQEYKTYCWHIAKRNNMQLVNEAVGGSTMHNNGTANAFSVSRYTQVPTDADYITLCFGLNETNATIGTLEDTTNATVMGAWNVVLEHLITNMPYAKIGIIIPDAWIYAPLREAMIDVAEHWGIPYLDLSGDPKVPLLIGGKRGVATLSPKAIALRNAAFQVSSTNEHPNPKAHAYRSTIIENFMRSL